MKGSDIIAAVASPPGTGAIGVVRVSGDGSWEVLSKVTGLDAKKVKPRRVYKALVRDENGEVDEVLLVFYKAPKSYTGEDMVEVFTHGGYVVTNMVLRAILNAGARQAGPGEFTKRAFLNGKMDLTEAEAIRDLIEAKTEKEVRVFLKGLRGGIREFVDEIRKDVIELLAEIEVELDYPEEIEVDRDRSLEKLIEIKKRLDEVVERAEYSVKASHGIKVVITGRPNVGKSTLLNRLLKEDRAIVTPYPGTTRDVITGDINIDGCHFVLSDTAGFREVKDEVEMIGIERAKAKIKEADLVLFVVDASEGFTEEDKKVYEMVGEKPCVLVMNKVDLVKEVHVPKLRGCLDVVKVSALTGEGIRELEKAIVKLSKDFIESLKADVVLTNQRQKELLEAARKSIEDGIEAFEQGFPSDIASLSIGEALEFLDKITGRSFREDLIDAIFSNFCVGK